MRYIFAVQVKPFYSANVEAEALTEKAAKAQVKRDVAYETKAPYNKVKVTLRKAVG